MFQDVTKRREMAMDLEFLARHDPLTKLPNRFHLKEKLGAAIDKAKIDKSSFGFIFCDLDRFKAINDLYGHASGDEVLKAVARRLRECTRSNDIVCRWAGDEFAILLPNIRSIEEVEAVAKRIVESSRAPIYLRSTLGRVESKLSIGISMFPDGGVDATALISSADTALYEVKRRGRDGFASYTPELQKSRHERGKREKLLRSALENGSVIVHYQPRIALRTGKMCGVEALVRLKDGDSLVFPGEFIEIAEETGLIHKLSEMVFSEVCQQIGKWRGTEFESLIVSINLSPIRLNRDTIVEEKKRWLDEFGIQADRIGDN